MSPHARICLGLVLLATTVVQLAHGQCNCENKPDGYVCSVGCKAMERCFNQQPVSVTCGENEVIDFENAVCVPTVEAPPPCGSGADKNCTGRPDGTYPDMETGCQTYYTCMGGNFYMRQFCPDGLVFNEYNGVCDWPDRVCPPCGRNTDEIECPYEGPCNCTGIDLGAVCYADCQVMITCGEDGQNNTIVCRNGEVVDWFTGSCAPEADVCPPCGTNDCIETTTAVIKDTCSKDGTKHFVSCVEYQRCNAGLLEQIKCDNNEVVDPNTITCTVPSEACPPCGNKTKCNKSFN